MASIEGNLVQNILCDHFGAVAKVIGQSLVEHSGQTLNEIFKYPGLKGIPKLKIRNAMLSLIHQNIVFFEKTGNRTIYNISTISVLLRLRYPRYLYLVKSIHSDIEESLLHYIIQSGRLSQKSAVHLTWEYINSLKEETEKPLPKSAVEDAFENLKVSKFIKAIVPATLAAELEDLHQNKRRRINDDEDEEEMVPKEVVNQMFILNYPVFHSYFRKELLTSYVKNRLDNAASIIMDQILNCTVTDLSDTPPCVSFFQIDDALKKDFHRLGKGEIKTYLELIVSESNGILRLHDESQAGRYQLDPAAAKSALQLNVIESTIQEKFGSAATRVFRCLQKHSHLDQQQVSHYCVLPLQETCVFLGQLYEEGFIFSQEIPKMADYSKTVALYSYLLSRTQSCVVAKLNKIAVNLLMRKESEILKNERLLDRLQRRDAGMAQTLLYVGLQDEENTLELPESDINALAKVQKAIKLITVALSKIDETLFIMRDL